jgi:hypothetical protein
MPLIVWVTEPAASLPEGVLVQFLGHASGLERGFTDQATAPIDSRTLAPAPRS